MHLHYFRCFGRDSDSGNAAAVVEYAPRDAEERQQFATQQQTSATVFVDPAEDDSLLLDYYYPHMRSPLCLHATLAAGAAYFEQNPGRVTLRAITSMRGQQLEIERDSSGIFITLQPQPCPTIEIDAETTAALLGLNPADVLGAPRLASVGSAKLLVEVASRMVLDALQPDLTVITDWGREHGVAGCYVYCHLGDNRYAGRNFNHLAPHQEDAATGVAAGALASLLEQDVTLLQGDALGQPCTLLARYANGRVQVGGQAVRFIP
jgi:PhzF family phenazine biosynthesis protein